MYVRILFTDPANHFWTFYGGQVKFGAFSPFFGAFSPLLHVYGCSTDAPNMLTKIFRNTWKTIYATPNGLFFSKRGEKTPIWRFLRIVAY
jgi:hypothetical protein